jgi:putative Mn2+ efflux pump MntP
MKKGLKILIFIGVLLVVAYFTNPKSQTHKNKVTERFQEQNPITGALGLGSFVTNIALEYNDYQIFSLGKFDNKIISIGLFGMVFIPASLDINQAIEK